MEQSRPPLVFCCRLSGQPTPSLLSRNCSGNRVTSCRSLCWLVLPRKVQGKRTDIDYSNQCNSRSRLKSSRNSRSGAEAGDKPPTLAQA